MIEEDKIKRYCECKQEAKGLDKIIKKLNEEIKQEMIAENSDTVCSGDYVIELETRVTEGFDEIKLLQVLKKYWEFEHEGETCPFIRTIEVVDEDALEKYMYNHSFPTDMLSELDKCRTKKVTKALTYNIKGT